MRNCKNSEVGKQPSLYLMDVRSKVQTLTLSPTKVKGSNPKPQSLLDMASYHSHLPSAPDSSLSLLCPGLDFVVVSVVCNLPPTCVSYPLLHPDPRYDVWILIQALPTSDWIIIPLAFPPPPSTHLPSTALTVLRSID